MKFQPDTADGVHQITHLGHDGLRVDGLPHAGSLVVPWKGDVASWRPSAFDDLCPACFDDLMSWRPEVVILGSGLRLRFTKPVNYKALIEAGIGLETMDTRAACRTFNVLASEGRRVLVALLPID